MLAASPAALLAACLTLLPADSSMPTPGADLPADSSVESSTDVASAPATVPLPTLGGSQFWGDVMLRRGWRIQRHAWTGTHRLLGPRQLQHAAGSREHCRAVLDRCAEPMTGEITLLIHGILRGSGSMGRVGSQLEQAGLQPLRWDYPSTQGTIDDAAGLLAETIDSLDPGVERINIVVHSMGGLVVRAYGRCRRDADQPCDPRLHRLVMIATPNLGAELASSLKEFPPFRLLFGPAGRQLAHDEDWLKTLPAPPMEFAVIAGERGNPSGYNPFLPGDDDGTITVASTRLSGAADSQTFVGMHSFLMYQPSVTAAVERFLLTGALRETGEREPIE